MKDNLRILFVLTGVCLICGLSLSVVYGLAQDKIEHNQQQRIMHSIKTIVPKTARINETEVEENIVYKIYNQQNNLVGYGFIAQGKGYGGPIKVMVAVNKEISEVFGIEIIESQETPGLGGKISNNSFKEQFSNVVLDGKFRCVKITPVNDMQVKAITGATISSKAVASIVNDKLNKMRQILPDEQ